MCHYCTFALEFFDFVFEVGFGCLCGFASPWDVCSTRHRDLSFGAASVTCEGEEEAFSLMQRVKPLHVAFV